MSSKSEKADAIKDHAIHGQFLEIGEKFGEKASIKGREYVRNFLRMGLVILFLKITDNSLRSSRLLQNSWR